MAEVTPRRRARLRITPRQIVELLELPEGSTVMAVQGSFDPVGIDVVVSHPNLAEVPDEAEAPFLHVTWGF